MSLKKRKTVWVPFLLKYWLFLFKKSNINFTFIQVDEKKRKIAANSNSKGGKTAKKPKIDNDVIMI